MKSDMTPGQYDLIERVRALVANEPIQREVSMFGGRSFMINELMIVSVLKDGGLLVRVSAEQHKQLLTEPGAMQAEMGHGRDMGPGWIEVAPASIVDDECLGYWIGHAMEYNRAATATRRQPPTAG